MPTIADLEAARGRLAGQAVLTPLLESPALNKAAGCRVLVKAEPLQRTGSFKFRGAYNRMSQLDRHERKAGVVAYSSGNHAQGVAAAAQQLGIQATILMPADAPRIKIENTRSYGAEVVTYDRYREVREAIGAQIAEECGAVLVPPYDDPDIIAGQGTCGLELAEQVEAAGAEVDTIFVPCGGGGLTAGINLAIADRIPGAAVYAVEPEDYDDTRRSFAAGERLPHPPAHGSICEALLSSMPGALTFSINREHLAAVLTVSDREAAAAMAEAFYTLKLIIEPGGAVALAAVLQRKIDLQGKTVAVVASGGNVDAAVFARALTPSG